MIKEDMEKLLQLPANKILGSEVVFYNVETNRKRKAKVLGMTGLSVIVLDKKGNLMTLLCYEIVSFSCMNGDSNG